MCTDGDDPTDGDDQVRVRSVQGQQGVYRNIEGLDVANQVVYTLIQTHEAMIEGHTCP